LEEIVRVQLKYSQTDLRYKLVFHKVDPASPAVLFEDEDIMIKSIILSHRIPCTGFLFSEKPRLRKLNKEKIKLWNIPVEAFDELKRGLDYTSGEGKVISNMELTVNPKAPRTYAFCSDTIYDETIVPFISGVDLL